ncbi:MAG TPA: NAD(P)H-binding protein [Solirubrobacteraceae bacterium]|nr:NAD(P)H-binding protein [Solirubrobacteraceae bacterium]
MRILVTGITGYVGGALAPRLLDEGHELRGLARDPARCSHAGIPCVRGDAVSGAGLDDALDGVDVAYYLIHSMETGTAAPSGTAPPSGGATAAASGFAAREERSAANFAEAAVRAGVRRVVYLGGPVPQDAPISPHLASRLAVEQTLLDAIPSSVALRASVVIGARSRSFRFLVRLVERMPFIPLPPWSESRTRPVDGRDVLAFLVNAATVEEAAGRSLDIAGPDTLTWGEMIERIRDLMIVGRPGFRLPISLTSVASRVGAAIAGEDPEFIGALMGSLGHDLLPRDDDAPRLLGVRVHRFDRAVEHALAEWERIEPGSVAAR